tara:strand:- start:15921 stop:16607 length:687 start_codon:yes stop_codon:yes gene_type:complete
MDINIDKRLAKICKFCEKEFRSTKKRRIYCSDDCFKESVKRRQREYSKKNNKIIREKRTTCRFCGEQFTKTIKGRCCSNRDCVEQKIKYDKITNEAKNKKRHNEQYVIKKEAERQRQYRKDHSKEINMRKRARQKEMREWVDSLKKEMDCNKCGEERWYCLEYHHIDPKTKRFSIADAVSGYYGKEAILKEMEKCVVLCANCHKELHYFEDQKSNEKKIQKEILNLLI